MPRQVSPHRANTGLRGDIPLPESPRPTPLERAKRHRVQAQEARLKAAQCTGEEQAAFIRLTGNWERLAREADGEAKTDADPTVEL
jgi:hypothetical protein